MIARARQLRADRRGLSKPLPLGLQVVYGDYGQGSGVLPSLRIAVQLFERPWNSALLLTRFSSNWPLVLFLKQTYAGNAVYSEDAAATPAGAIEEEVFGEP